MVIFGSKVDFLNCSILVWYHVDGLEGALWVDWNGIGRRLVYELFCIRVT
jgi:hypothetical protein